MGDQVFLISPRCNQVVKGEGSPLGSFLEVSRRDSTKVDSSEAQMGRGKGVSPSVACTPPHPINAGNTNSLQPPPISVWMCVMMGGRADASGWMCYDGWTPALACVCCPSLARPSPVARLQ